MSLRQMVRQLVIKGTTVLGLNAAHRSHQMIGAQAGHCIRVFYFHGTPARYAWRLRRQLDWLTTHFDVIDFEEFTQAFATSRARRSRPAALLTFDDGFASNYDVAAPLLEGFGLRGVFFVVPQFSMAADTETARGFFADRILAPMAKFERAMTPVQIRDLARRGHTIGNHTLTHARLSDTPAADVRREIDGSAALIESWIDGPVEAFAWPFVWDAITPDTHAAARARHAYCFSPCTGMVDVRRDAPSLLWRTNAEADRRFSEFRFQCSGLADYASAARRRDLTRRLLQAAAVRPAAA